MKKFSSKSPNVFFSWNEILAKVFLPTNPNCLPAAAGGRGERSKTLTPFLNSLGGGGACLFRIFLFLGFFTGLRGRVACFFQDKHKETRKMSTHPNVNLFSFSDLGISKLYKTIYWPTMHHLKLIFSQYATCNLFSQYATFNFFWKLMNDNQKYLVSWWLSILVSYDRLKK